MENEFNPIEYVKTRLGGKAHHVICCHRHRMEVYCESWHCDVKDPRTADLVEYAKIDMGTGEVYWTEFSDLLNEEQRAEIEKSAMKYRK